MNESCVLSKILDTGSRVCYNEDMTTTPRSEDSVTVTTTDGIIGEQQSLVPQGVSCWTQDEPAVWIRITGRREGSTTPHLLGSRRLVPLSKLEA